MKSQLRKLYRSLSQLYWFNKLQFILHAVTKNKQYISLYYAKNGNFGDELNEDLMDYIDVPYVHARPLAADACCIGSNLQEFVAKKSVISEKHTIDILGSGFISESKKDERFIFDVNVRGVRGKLSLHRCETILDKELPNTVLGDPGLLIRRIFPDTKLSEDYDVGIIAHVVDKDSFLLKNIKLEAKKLLFIDIEQPTASFVEQVAQCKFILSSAMHGLICADSLGVPNKHIVLSNKVVGGEYKFRDYYSIFQNFNYSPIYLASDTVTSDDIEVFKKKYTISSNEIERVCDNLEEMFRLYKENKADVKSL